VHAGRGVWPIREARCRRRRATDAEKELNHIGYMADAQIVVTSMSKPAHLNHIVSALEIRMYDCGDDAIGAGVQNFQKSGSTSEYPHDWLLLSCLVEQRVLDLAGSEATRMTRINDFNKGIEVYLRTC
jgi:hypothetical protein